MACNCATKEEIDKLYRIYGEKSKINKDDKPIEKIKKVAYFIISIFLYVIALPLMFVYVLLVIFWKFEPKIDVQSINLLKLFKIKV